jgi:hypothetical protein
MIGTESFKIKDRVFNYVKLSKTKIQLDYDVPVYLFDDKSGILKKTDPIESISVKLRYYVDSGYNVGNFKVITKSLEYYTDNLQRRVWRSIQAVGEIHKLPIVEYRAEPFILSDTMRFHHIIKCFLVNDDNYLSAIRNNKLNELFK